jgi:hypothetical protein
MQITVDTKNDSHDDIRKVIAMLKHIVGEQDVLTNAPMQQPQNEQPSDFASLLGDLPSAATQEPDPASSQIETTPAQKTVNDLFSDLLSEEDLPEAKSQPEEEEEDETAMQQKKPKIEFY